MREGQKIRDEREALKRAQTAELRKTEETFRKRLELAEEQRTKWRRDAALELEIERQMNEQLIQKHQTEYQQLQDKLPTLVHSATRVLEEEVRCVRKDSSEREERLLREQRVEVEHLQINIQEHQQEALQLREENTTLHKEICLLQETVRLECEERAELTAALSLAREQLLGVRRAALNPSIPRSTAPPSLPSLSAGPSRDAVSRGRSTASWHGNSRQLLPALPRLTTERPAPVTEARHHIGTVAGRKGKRSR